MTVEFIEKGIAVIFAVVIGITTVWQMRAEWHATGLDNNLTKLMLGLMAFGCVLVLLVAFGVIGGGSEAKAA